jgi:hypothetical protein
VAGGGTVAEGGVLVFTVSKAGAATASFSVNYATANGSAAAGSDYTGTSGTLTFAPSETSKTVPVQTIDDLLVESAETVLMNLSGASGGATISSAQASGTITSNDTANTPPTAANDTQNIPNCTTVIKNVTANDSDADGDLPLTITGITLVGAAAQVLSASIAGASGIEVTSQSTGGSYFIDYTIADSRGASGSARLTVTIPTTGLCNP